MVISIDENLRQALKILKGPREKEYGNKKANHENIAGLWSAYLGRDISAHDKTRHHAHSMTHHARRLEDAAPFSAIDQARQNKMNCRSKRSQ